MAYQIDLFCVPQLADTGCLEADHNGGSGARPADDSRHDQSLSPRHHQIFG
jgi:hypothetical protein